MEEQAFLEQVAQAVKQGHRFRSQVPSQPPVSPVPAEGRDLVEWFLQELQQVGGVGHRAQGAQETRRTISTWLHQHQVREVLLWEHKVLEELGLEDHLRRQGLKTWLPDQLASFSAEERKQIVFGAQAGITAAQWAVAESGTVVLPSTPSQPRSTSLLPPVAIAVVRAQQVVADLFEVFQHWEAAPLPSYVALVTGPSKTGDIQLQLTTGVHGPGHWYVVVWDQER